MIQPTVAPMLQPSAAPISSKSYKEIKKEYTQILLIEKDLDRALENAGAEVAKWEERLDLARQHNNEKLVNEALISLQTAQSNEMSLFQQKDQIAQQKAVLKQNARHCAPQSSPASLATSASLLDTFIDDEFYKPEDDALENEFKTLQRQQKLANLRAKMGLR